MKRAVPRVKKGRKAKKVRPSQTTRARPPSPGPAIDARSVTDLVETCRAKVEKLLKPSQITYLSLFEYYDYEGDDPELWQCCWLVCLLLRQTYAALLPLDVAPRKIFPSECADIATGCEAQQRWLRPAIHVLRSIIFVLIDRKVDHLDEMISALRKLERDIDEVIGALQQVIHCCHLLVGRRAAR
jgi:hypothetical protein